MTTEPKPSNLRHFAAATLTGLAVGYAAAMLQTIRAPVGLFPLATGIVGGIILGLIAKSAGVGRLVVFVAATLAAVVCLATIHYFSYRQAKAAVELQAAAIEDLRAKFPEAQAPTTPPPSLGGFREYLEREWEIGRKLGPLPVRGALLLLWWIIDALLLWVGATVAALVIATGAGPAPTTLAKADA